MMTEEVHESKAVWLRQTGWWVYDWQEYKTVQTFPLSEKAQAEGLCKLLNSIEEETNGIQK
jgi:hypothetical protein